MAGAAAGASASSAGGSGDALTSAASLRRSETIWPSTRNTMGEPSGEAYSLSTRCPRTSPISSRRICNAPPTPTLST